MHEFRILEAGAEIQVIEPRRAWNRIQQTVQDAAGVTRGRKQRPVVEPRGIPLRDLLNAHIGERDRVVGRWPFDGERRVVAGTDVDHRPAGLEPVGGLNEAGVESERDDGLPRLFTQRIGADRAHQ